MTWNALTGEEKGIFRCGGQRGVVLGEEGACKFPCCVSGDGSTIGLHAFSHRGPGMWSQPRRGGVISSAKQRTRFYFAFFMIQKTMGSALMGCQCPFRHRCIGASVWGMEEARL